MPFLKCLIFWDISIRHFVYTAFLLCQTILYLHVFVNKQRLFMLIIHNFYPHIFHLTQSFLPCNWCYRATGAFGTYCVLTLSNYAFLKTTFKKIVLKKIVLTIWQNIIHIIFSSKNKQTNKNKNGHKVTHYDFTLWAANFIGLYQSFAKFHWK